MILLETNIVSIELKNSVYKIELNNNSTLEVDFIIAGIGSKANTDLFENTSLNINNGIVTDEFCRTSEESVYAYTLSSDVLQNSSVTIPLFIFSDVFSNKSVLAFDPIPAIIKSTSNVELLLSSIL